MNYNHLIKDIQQNILQFSSKKAIYYKNNTLKIWQGISWKDFGNQIQKLSKSLLNFGIQPQQNIAIFAQNMPEWIIADIAVLSVRAVTIPIYATNSVKEAAYIINNAETSIVFVGSQDQYDKAYEISKTSPFLKLIVVFDKSIVLEQSENSIYYNNFLNKQASKEIEAELYEIENNYNFDDLASIIYTSGTTGEPKGVMLNHHNFAASLKAHDNELTISEKDVSLSFLPLSHIFERSWVFFCLHRGIAVYFNEDPKQIASVLLEVKPTVMCTVPRLYEKVFAGIQEKKSEATPIKLRLFNWALAIGNDYYNNYKRNELKAPIILALKHKIADKLVLKKLRGIFGGRINFMPCGGAALSADLVAFFHAFGINVKCGYGLTESTATATLFGDTFYEYKSAGKPISGTQIKIGENNEILIKGPGVMLGYYKKPAETEAVFKDGWFCSGDAGKIDENGNLFITDRIKDLIKTSGGKYIAPQKLETAFVSDSFVDQIVIIGEGRKFVSALIVPCFECIKKYALKNKISFSSVEDLIANNHVKTFLEEKFEHLQKDFSRFEKIKKFTILPKEFTMDAGEITATLKLKRKAIQKKYKHLIEKMYSD